MEHLFDLITQEEKIKLLNAIPEITMLIAGADGEIEKEETDWALKLTEIRSFAHHQRLHTFYENVGLNLKQQLTDLQDSLPKDTGMSTRILAQRLEELNPILSKLPEDFGALLYKSFVSFAKHIAKASGGVLGFGSISSDEAKLMDLPMLTPIFSDEEE